MDRLRLRNEAVDLRKCDRGLLLDLERCTITGAIELGANAGEWASIIHCHLSDCSQVHVSIATAAFENVTVKGLRRGGRSPLYLWACVFREVTLAGAIQGMKINPEIGLAHRRSPKLQQAWAQAAVGYYKHGSWALDIREAHFSSVPTFEAIPGDRILIDPRRQALVRRAALVGRDVRSLPKGTALDWFVRRSSFDSVVLAASSSSDGRDRDLDNLARLRDMGIAEPAN